MGKALPIYVNLFDLSIDNATKIWYSISTRYAYMPCIYKLLFSNATIMEVCFMTWEDWMFEDEQTKRRNYYYSLYPVPPIPGQGGNKEHF